VVSGRDLIGKLLADEFASNPGTRLETEVESVRPLSPDVVVEKGISTLSAPDGPQGTSSYVAVYVKRAGAWKISQLSETTVPSSSSEASSRLHDLAWMVGDWQDEADHIRPCGRPARRKSRSDSRLRQTTRSICRRLESRCGQTDS
jgi:hypothetical protein